MLHKDDVSEAYAEKDDEAHRHDGATGGDAALSLLATKWVMTNVARMMEVAIKNTNKKNLARSRIRQLKPQIRIVVTSGSLIPESDDDDDDWVAQKNS